MHRVVNHTGKQGGHMHTHWFGSSPQESMWQTWTGKDFAVLFNCSFLIHYKTHSVRFFATLQQFLTLSRFCMHFFQLFKKKPARLTWKCNVILILFSQHFDLQSLVGLLVGCLTNIRGNNLNNNSFRQCWHLHIGTSEKEHKINK